MSVRIAIVDDHPVVANGLEGALRCEPGVEIVGTAASLAGARELIADRRPDVVLLDLRLPDGSGFELLADARVWPAPPAFVIVSSFGMPQYVDAALRQGASGFVLKTTSTAEIVAAVRKVAEGGDAFAPELLLAVQRSGWTPLSPRDRRLVELVVEGRTNDEISGILGITRKGVEAHLARLFERSGVQSRTELAVRAEREGWTDVPTKGLESLPPSPHCPELTTGVQTTTRPGRRPPGRERIESTRSASPPARDFEMAIDTSGNDHVK